MTVREREDQVVDLSARIEPSPEGTPEFQRNAIEYLDHVGGAAEIEQLYGVPSELLRDGEGWTRETVTLGTHNSTHVDAPYHTTRPSRDSGLRRSMNFRSRCSSATGWCSI